MTAESTELVMDAVASLPQTPAVRVRHLTHAYPTSRRARKAAAAAASVATDQAAEEGTVASRPPRTAALDDVSFEVQRGEIFGILGPNGGGKTTLFRILSTTLQPSRPDFAVEIFGHDVIREPDAVRRRLGVVFQSPSLDGKLTVKENLRCHGRLYGLGGSDLRQRIREGLNRFGLSDRLHDLAETLSGGQRRRVELAKALLHEPQLLLMDEPATGLDPGARRDLWHSLEQLREHHEVTVALTTHLMDEADRCDRLAIIVQGRLVALDTPANLKARIGGDVISVEPNPQTPDNSPQQLAAMIAERFGPWQDGDAPRVLDGRVHFEKPRGSEIIPSLTGAWPDRIRSVTVGQPTLEDVFLHLTGHAFHTA